MERYIKQIKLDLLGEVGQEKLFKSNVLIVGCGGLGSPVIDYLSRAGVGKIGIIDYDKVEISNLHRQSIFFEKDVGIKKVIYRQNIHGIYSKYGDKWRLAIKYFFDIKSKTFLWWNIF